MNRIEPGFDYAHVISDTQVADGPGMLHAIVINGPPSADGVVTVYDSLTGAGVIIAILTISVADSISVQPISLLYDVDFSTGLYLDFDGALAVDLTVSYVA